MEKFAKLFESEKYGQLVAIMQQSDNDGPEIRLFLKPKGLGVCSIAMQFEDDTDSSWDSCEKIFEAFDLAKAEAMAKGVADQLNGFMVSEEGAKDGK